MRKKLFTFLLICFPAMSIHAQTTVVFNVDMKAMLADSTFIPNDDALTIKGNLYPLDPAMSIIMEDGTPADSIYSIELRFPRQHDGKELKFNFEITRKRKTTSEQVTRALILDGQEIKLQPLGFNYFIR